MKARFLIVVLFAAASHAQEAPSTEASKYHELLRRRPQAGTIFERFQDAWLAEGTRESLREFLKSKSTAANAMAADHQLLALFLARQGEDAAAVTELDAALKLNSANPDAWLEMARAQTRLIEFDKALTSLDEAAKIVKDENLRVEIARLQGRALLRLGRNDEALKIWQQLAASRPDDLDLAEEVVELMADEGLYAEAAAQAEALVKKTKAATDLMTRRLRLGDLLLRADKRDEALAMLESVLEQSGQDSWVEGDVLTRIAQPFRREDNIEGLKIRLEKLHVANPQRPAVTMELALVLADLGEKDAAVKLVTELLIRTPGRRDLQERFVSMLERVERFEEAAAQMKRLVEQHADDKELLIRLATLQEKLKDAASAQATLDLYLKKAAVKDAPAAEHDYLRVARLFESWEMKESAGKAYAALAAAHPDSVSAKEALAHFYHRTEANEKALEIWRALTKTGGLEDVLRVGQALTSHGKQKEALELLSTRMDEFSKQPRFLAQLSLLATTLKDHANAMLWARQRLVLITDHAAVQEAVRMAQLAIEDAEAVKAVIDELQKKAEGISVPDRCLLAALLEDEEQVEEAEKTLLVPSAAPADQLMFGGQRARLLETRQEWARAAEVITGMMKLPGGQTSEHARRLVSLHRRALANDKALAVIPEWKKLSPGAVQPWLEESAIQLEQGKESASLDVLRQAARKFADERQVLSTLADALARAGRTEEARQAYVSLYEQTEDIQTRLRLLAPLAEMSRAEGRLDSLLDEFQTRQRQNRGSAAPWMALAEIHRATNNDEERRRCLYEASRLRPKDLALLTEIARCEEDSGLTKEALRTLESAALLDKSNSTRHKIAQLMIESGDDEAGYRLIFELAGGAEADARALEKMADTMCEHGDWARAIRFLEPLLPNFPDDYRLRYLHATALEQEGRDKEAAAAFTELLSFHVEMPEVSALQAQQMLHGNAVNLGSFSYGENYQLPDGAAEWMTIPSVASAAYEYRNKQSNLGSGWGGFNSSGTLIISNQPGVATPAPGLPRGWVTQPANVTLLSAMAVYHLIEIGQGMSAPDKEALAAQMSAAGVRDAALILEVPMYQGSFGIPTELLDEHPDHAALHAVWLISNNFYRAPEDDSIAVLRRCMKLFKETRPMLAWQAGARALMLGTPEGLEIGREAIAMAEEFSETDSSTVHSLVSVLAIATHDPSYGSQMGVDLPADVLDALFALGQRWNERSYERLAQRNGYWSGAQLISALASAGRWDQLAAELERENNRGLDLEKKQKTRASVQNRQFMTGSQMRLSPQPVQPVWSDLEVSAIAANITANLRRTSNVPMGYGGEDNTESADEESVRTGLERVLAQLKTPGLKLLLNVRLNHHEEVEKGVTEMLGGPNLRADHWLLAAWAAQSTRDWPRVVECLQKAAALGGTANYDNAIIYAAQKADADGRAKMHEALKAVYARLNRPNMQQYEMQQLLSVMRATGFEKESEEMQAREITKKTKLPSPGALAAVNPYSHSNSRNFSSNGSLGPLADKLIAAGQLDAAWPEILRGLRPQARQWLDIQQWGNVRYTLRQTIESLERRSAAVGFAKWLAARKASGWREMIEDAALLELLNQDDDARARYETAIQQQPRAWQAHARAAALTADKDSAAAAKLLLPIPPSELARYFSRLAQECSRSDEHSTFEHRLALIRMFTGWLDAQVTQKRRLDPLLASVVMNMPQNIQQSEYRDPIRFDSLYSVAPDQQKPTEASVKAKQQLREAHDAFCTAMLRLPMLAEGGFGPLAGLALRDKAPLDKLEQQALEVLSAKGWIQRASPAMMYWNGYSNSRFGAQNQIAMPHPEDILVLAAARRGEFDKIEKEITPLIEKAKGRNAAKQALAYAALFRAGNDTFTTAAEDWLKSMSPRADPGAGAEIVRIWAERKLSAPIHGFFLERLKTQRGGINNEEISRYILTLENSGNTKEASAFIRRVRDLWIGATPEQRSAALQAYVKERQSQRRGGFFISSNRAPTFNNYLQLHQTLLQASGGSVAGLPVLIEDGMLDEQTIVESIGYRLIPETTSKGPTEKLIAHLNLLHLLDEAPTFRAWFNSNDRTYTVMSRLLGELGNSDSKESAERFRKALEARKPATFGSQLMLALMDNDSRKRAEGLTAFLTAHGSELAKLSLPAREEVHALFHQRVNAYPGYLADAQKEKLTPLLEAETTALMKLGEKILAATTWETVGMEEYNARQSIPPLLARIARADRTKAVEILEKTVTLLKGTPNHLQNIANGNSGVFELLGAMGRAPQLMKEVGEIATREKAPARWAQGYAYSLDTDNALRDTEHVLAIFTGTPFVADAADFRCIPLSGRSEASTLNRIAENLRSGSYKAAHDALEKALKERQPQTFGVKTTLLLMAGSNIQTDTYVRENGADFAKLRPEEADGLMRTLEKRNSKYATPDKLPQDVRDALQPLLAMREKQQDVLVSRILGAPTLQSVSLSSNDNEMLSGILRRLHKADAEKAGLLFEKLTLLFMGETRRQNGSQPEHTPLAYWLHESAGVAPFFTLAMKRAELEGITPAGNWLSTVESEIEQNNQLRDPVYVTTLLGGSAFLEDAERFQAWPIQGGQDGSLLNRILRYAKDQEPVKKAVRELLTKMKATFGAQLVLACLDDEPKQALRDFITKNSSQIAALGRSGLAGFASVLEKQLSPLPVHARSLPALAPVIAFEKKRASDLADTYLAVRDRNALYRISNNSNAYPYDTAFIASYDAKRGVEVAQHVLKPQEVEDSHSSGNRPEYTYAARFLEELNKEPALWPFMSTEAVKRKLHTNDSWRQNATCALYPNGQERDATFVVDLFERAGFFAAAEAYNPLPGLGGKQSPSVLDELMRSTWWAKNRMPMRDILRNHIDAQKTRTFGMNLVRALVDPDGDEAVKQFVAANAAELLKLPKDVVPQIADILASRTDELIDYPAPLLDLIKQKASGFHDQVLAGKPFEEFKLDQKTFETEFTKVLGTTYMRKADFTGGAVFFDKALRIMEAQQQRAGWGNGINNGWTLRSETLGNFMNGKPVNVFCFAMHLYHEDDSGLLAHNGWHTADGCGQWMRSRWEFWGGRASAAEGMNGLVDEMARYLKAEHATLLGLGFHNLFTRLMLSDVNAITVWAEKEKAAGARAAILRELAIAGRLFLTACAESRGRDGTCVSGSTPVIDLLMKHHRAAVMNEKVNPRVRIALVHHLCNVCPFAVPDDLVKKGAQLAAQENKELHAIHGYQLAHIIRRFVQLPVDDEWKRIAQEFWDGWTRRQSFAKEKRERGRYYGTIYAPTFAMVQVAARAHNERWLTQLIEKDAPYLKTMRTTVMLIATSGWEQRAAEFLTKEASHLQNWQSDVVKWEPGFEKHAAALAKACKDPGLGLLGELITAESQDFPMPMVRTFKQPTTCEQRIAALAPRFAKTTFKNDKLRVSAATLVSNYAPRAAVEHLSSLLEEEAKKIDTAAFAMIRVNAERAEAAYVLSTPIVKSVLAGDAKLWSTTFDTLAGITGDDLYFRNNARNLLADTLADSISAHWKSGTKHEADFWKQIIMPVIDESENHSDDHTGHFVSLLMPLLAASGDSTLADWRKSLTRPQLSTIISALGKKDEIWRNAGRLAGDEAFKTRLSLEARMRIVTHLLADDVIAGRNTPTLFTKIMNERLLSDREIAENAESLFAALAKKNNLAITLAEIALDRGKSEIAIKLLDAALAAKPTPTADHAFDLLEMRFGLEVRGGRKTEATAALAKLEAHERAAANKFTIPILQRLLSEMK